MIKRPNYDLARSAATKLLREHKVTTYPVPVERIAKQMGARVEYAPLDGDLSGFAHIRDGIAIVGINALHAPTRQRFTLAHELAHVILHRSELEAAVHVDRGSLRRDALASEGTDSTEIEANTFAAELLMPKPFLESALNGRTVDLEDDEAVTTLAKRFKVSEAAMRHRLESPFLEGQGR
jgi:Zn-dependent peptidase ImmA (M78 family)